MKISQVLFLMYIHFNLLVSNGSRILAIFPFPVKSHFLCNEAIMRSLYNAGHQVTFLSPFSKDESQQNYTVIDTRQDDSLLITNQLSLEDLKVVNFWNFVFHLTDIETRICEDVLSLKEIQDLLKLTEKQYDVMFLEVLTMDECYLPLAEKLGIPVIATITFRSWPSTAFMIGNPDHPALVPGIYTSFSDHMTFSQRLKNVLYLISFYFHLNFILPQKFKKIVNKFYPEDVINRKKVSLAFVNNHFTFLTTPATPNVIDIGGIHVKQAKSLPKDFQTFIDDAEHGVLVFSLGSTVRTCTMTSKMRNAFRDAFAEIPQRVIWKFEEQIENLSANVLLAKWIPQRDILAHVNVKVFISHGGVSGCYEAINEGVPVILTPIFLDQMSNAALFKQLGVGVQLDLYTVTKNKILQALNALINDTRYRDNMRELSRRFKDRPMSPQESVVYWTEYVIRHNDSQHMRIVGADMPLYQYLLLDVIAVMVTTFATSFCLLFWITRKIYLRLFFKKPNIIHQIRMN